MTTAFAMYWGKQFWTRGTSNHASPQGGQDRGESRRELAPL